MYKYPDLDKAFIHLLFRLKGQCSIKCHEAQLQLLFENLSYHVLDTIFVNVFNFNFKYKNM